VLLPLIAAGVVHLTRPTYEVMHTQLVLHMVPRRNGTRGRVMAQDNQQGNQQGTQQQQQQQPAASDVPASGDMSQCISDPAAGAYDLACLRRSYLADAAVMAPSPPCKPTQAMGTTTQILERRLMQDFF
jgi:hypothetical protein